MIFDCFTFFNELEILEIRLNELYDVVDKFILLEATVTFTNKKKRLFFEENKKYFKQFEDKIIHVVVQDSPNVLGNPWIIEEYQFNSLTRGLVNCSFDDIVLLSCVDEIPNRFTKNQWNPRKGSVIGLSQKFFYYYLNCQVLNYPWIGTRIVCFGDINNRNTPYIIRHRPVDKLIQNGGWHFSFIGGPERIREKIFSYSHQEFNNPKYNTIEKIKLSLLKRKDLFGRKINMEVVDDEVLPNFLVKNKNKFENLFITKKTNKNLLLKLLFFTSLNVLKSIGRSFKKILRNIN